MFIIVLYQDDHWCDEEEEYHHFGYCVAVLLWGLHTVRAGSWKAKGEQNSLPAGGRG